MIEKVDKALHYDAIDHWFTEVLRLERQPLDDMHRAFRFDWTQHTLLPREPWQRLIDEDKLAQPMTYDRSYAAHGKGLRLVRSGLELVDSLDRLLRWDDRGTAFATWRLDPRFFRSNLATDASGDGGPNGGRACGLARGGSTSATSGLVPARSCRGGNSTGRWDESHRAGAQTPSDVGGQSPVRSQVRSQGDGEHRTSSGQPDGAGGSNCLSTPRLD